MNVTGGVEDYNILPMSVGLATVYSKTKLNPIHCTGGFISDRLLLTAAHCVGGYANPTSKRAVIFTVISNVAPFKDQLLTGKAISVHPEFNGLSDTATWASDLAFILFPAGTASKEMIIPLAQVAPQVGDEIQLVGWGEYQRGKKVIGDKRFYGRNKIFAVDTKLKDVIFMKGVYSSMGAPEDFHHASSGSGDSGGPLYNLNNEIIGILSVAESKGKKGNEEAYTMSRFTNILHPTNRQYIEDTLKAHPSEAGAPSPQP